MPTATRLWICGDCHNGNLGLVAAEAATIDIELRDLDQTARARRAAAQAACRL